MIEQNADEDSQPALEETKPEIVEKESTQVILTLIIRQHNKIM